MIKIARTLRMGIAAFAISAAAAATTIAPAQAAPAAPLPTVGIGSSAVNDILLVPGTPGDGSSAGSRNAGIAAAASPAQRFFYLGPANPNAAPKQTIFTFSPIGLLPGFIQPLFGWFTQNLNFEACVAGVSAKIGPYGTFSVSVGRQGC